VLGDAVGIGAAGCAVGWGGGLGCTGSGVAGWGVGATGAVGRLVGADIGGEGVGGGLGATGPAVGGAVGVGELGVGDGPAVGASVVEGLAVASGFCASLGSGTGAADGGNVGCPSWLGIGVSGGD
jgi:hypothetical protein